MVDFSFIVPVYNVLPYLRTCLDSILAQAVESWEAICVDDGSTDGSGDVLDEYARRDCRIKVVHQANAGVASARNVALNLAQGERICFVDADDVIAKHYLCLSTPSHKIVLAVTLQINGATFVCFPFALKLSVFSIVRKLRG